MSTQAAQKIAYPDIQLHIAGQWRAASSGEKMDILNPATGEPIGSLAVATIADLDEALEAADRGFATWRRIGAFDRYKIMRKAAELIRERAETIATIMVMEQGKPFAEAKGETLAGADTIDWFAEEARRAYGRIVPARAPDVMQLVIKEPVGPVAAFTPWNFPINQAVRKVSGALAAGCSVILKGPEDTPASCAELIKAFNDAGVPKDVLNLVYGNPAQISEYLIPHPVIRKISFTGSTAIGKQLAALAGAHMKRVTMELGGHAPSIVFKDANLEKALKVLSANKYRNAGQVCVAPTRFLVHESVFDKFVDEFVTISKNMQVGDGLDPNTNMGPLAHARRIDAMEDFVADAESRGGELRTGGKRIGNRGYFFEPTVFTNMPLDSKIMNEEPFGPISTIQKFSDDEEAFVEANRLPYGLAAYAYTESGATAAALAERVESGMISINHHGIALPETPFGGVKDSGYGSEGGLEAIEAYLNTKFVTKSGL
jgi:succinate-semialdehyde dehydrogenase/glutarate-semialdehyde dehydrogenase